MKFGDLREWGQRVIALVSVLAVVLGFAPQPSADRGAGLAPPSTPEVRAYSPQPPLPPQEIGEAPALPKRFAPVRTRAGSVRLDASPEFAPSPRILSGVAQLDPA